MRARSGSVHPLSVLRPTLLAAVWVALSAVVWLPGCGPARHDPPPDAFTSPEPLLAALVARQAGLSAVVAEARMEYYGGDGVRKGKVVVAVRRPDQLRFEALSPTGDFLALLTSDGERFLSFDRGGDRCYVGPSCPTNVGRLVPLALSGEAVVHVLLGEAPLIPHSESTLTFNRATGRYDLELRAPARAERQRVALDPQDLSVRKLRIWRYDQLVLSVDYEDLRPLGDRRLTREIRVKIPDRKVDLSIEYRHVERDPTDLAADVFGGTCPKGTQRWWLDCDGSAPRPMETEDEK